MAREGAIPAGSLANHEFYSKYVIWEPSAPEKLQPVFYDAETLGGVLIAVQKEKSNGFLK